MILNLFKQSVVCAFAIGVLASCGGGATSTAMTPTVIPSASYQRLSDTTTISTNGVMGGMLISDVSTGARSVSSVDGALTHNTQNISLTFPNYTFVSDVGNFNVSGLTADSNGATLLANAGLGIGYEFLRVYNGTYTASGIDYDTVGVIGIETKLADMPTTGTAVMSGVANLTAHTENEQTVLMNNGTVSLTAAFGGDAPDVDMTMSGFTTTNASGIALSDVPFTAVSIADMSLSGNQFAGGTVTFTTPDSDTTPLGDNQNHVLQGTFYGLTADVLQPYEAGGVLLIEGDTGQVSGVFVVRQ